MNRSPLQIRNEVTEGKRKTSPQNDLRNGNAWIFSNTI